MKLIDNRTWKKRTPTKLGGRVMTDPSFKNELDINVIMTKYAKTGILPHFPEKVGQYADVSNIPTLEQAKRSQNAASKAFQDLPLEIRQACNDDPSKLELLISQNPALCLKHGLLEKIDQPPEKTVQKGEQNEPKRSDNNNASD